MFDIFAVLHGGNFCNRRQENAIVIIVIVLEGSFLQAPRNDNVSQLLIQIL